MSKPTCLGILSTLVDRGLPHLRPGHQDLRPRARRWSRVGQRAQTRLRPPPTPPGRYLAAAQRAVPKTSCTASAVFGELDRHPRQHRRRRARAVRPGRPALPVRTADGADARGLARRRGVRAVARAAADRARRAWTRAQLRASSRTRAGADSWSRRSPRPGGSCIRWSPASPPTTCRTSCASWSARWWPTSASGSTSAATCRPGRSYAVSVLAAPTFDEAGRAGARAFLVRRPFHHRCRNQPARQRAGRAVSSRR